MHYVRQKLKLAFDQDEVLALLIDKFIPQYNQDFNQSLEKEDITDWGLNNFLVPSCDVHLYFNQPDYYRNLEVRQNAKTVLKSLMTKYDLYIATDAMYAVNSMVSKYEWLREHFSFIKPSNFIFTGDKSTVGCDILIDDGLHNLRAFRGTLPIVFDAPWNRSSNEFIRVHDMVEIYNLLK